MKRFVILAVWLCSSGICLAQDYTGELQLTYQRVQSFTFNSGSSFFNVDGAALNGGGFGFVYNITNKFGLFQQMGFFGGVEQNGLKIRMITELQGVRLTAHKGPFDFYAKGGLGFTRYVFEVSGGTAGVDSHLALVYGGGTEFRIPGGLFMIIDASRLTMGLPNLTNLPGRSKWSNSFLLSTGVAFRF
ncbi:MAG: hypothetical protein LAP85_09020 [Acidobacteriia bacterium]|nr:hypothetical protein [Terriglobia bacterium]